MLVEHYKLTELIDYHFARPLVPLPPIDQTLLLEYAVGSNGVFARGQRPGLSVSMPISFTLQEVRGLVPIVTYAEWGYPKVPAPMLSAILAVSSYVGKYDETLLLGAEVTLLVGCVDNADARRALSETLKHNEVSEVPSIWWLDCGNLAESGRVLLGSAHTIEQLEGAFLDEKTCIALPSPVMQSPGLLMAQPEETGDQNMSCAAMAAANLQSLNINARIAAEAADMITRLLVTKDLKRFAAEVNLAAGVVKSRYITPNEVADVVRRPPGFLIEQKAAVAGGMAH